MIEPIEPVAGPHQGQPLLVAGKRIEQAQAAMIILHSRGASAGDVLAFSAEFRQPDFVFLAPQAAGKRRNASNSKPVPLRVCTKRLVRPKAIDELLGPVKLFQQ